MNDLGIIASGSGLSDGLNPCIFMTCAVIASLRFWMQQRQLRVGLALFIFVLVYGLNILSFNFGPAGIFVFQKKFIFAAKLVYFILGLWSFIQGILFFKDWLLSRRSRPVEDVADETTRVSTKSGPAVYVLAMVLAVALSALATLWPVNNNIVLLGSETILRGQWQAAVPFLAAYVLASMWPLWFVIAFLNVKNLRPSLVRIFSSSIFFTASSCMILIFK